tara:strand:+ start:692 stop:1084 length:393 start_codon:yes stop_codon:yes gene_type:complete
MSRPFKGLYLQKTGAPFFFSFVTYTPQTKEQMISSGDLAEDEEFLSQIACDFLLFLSEGILGRALTADFPISYDDICVVCSRKRGDGIQHEYLIQIVERSWTNYAQIQLLDELTVILSHTLWNGAILRGE